MCSLCMIIEHPAVSFCRNPNLFQLNIFCTIEYFSYCPHFGTHDHFCVHQLKVEYGGHIQYFLNGNISASKQDNREV